MIRGHFHEGRPFIDGLLRVWSGGFGVIHFLVDTGADSTIVHPADYRAIGITFASLKGFPKSLR